MLRVLRMDFFISHKKLKQNYNILICFVSILFNRELN